MTLRIEREVCEPIGFQVEHQVERGARNPVLVHGDVVAGERVVGAALRFHEPVEFARRALRGAVEHHVFEEMREAGDAGHFVAAADAHPVVERDVGDVAIGPDDDLHAVGQRRRLHLVEPGHAARRGAGLVAAAACAAPNVSNRQAHSARTTGDFGMRHLDEECALYTATGKEKRRKRGKSFAAPKKRTPGKSCSQFFLR